MGFLVFVIIIFLFYQKQQISNLQSQLNKKTKKDTEILSDEPISIPIPIPLANLQNQSLYPENTNNYVSSEDMTNPLFDWIKQDFMLKLGSFLILLAMGWFVSYAFANNWIGEVGRIILGILLGVTFMAIGVWRIEKFSHQGGIFTILGATTILLTTYTAREMYDMFSPVSALFIMLLAISLVAFVSVRYNSERLAMAGLVLGSFAPLFTATPAPEVGVIFPYLLVVVAGTLWVVWQTGWTKLTLVALLITYLHSLPFLSYRVGDRDAAIMFSFLFVAIFFLANLVSLVRRRMEDKHLGIHALTALGTVIFLFSWIQTAANSDWRSLLYVAWALVFALGSYVVFVATANYKAFYLYGGTAVTLIGIATAVELGELGNSVLAIAYALEITMLIIGAKKITERAGLLTKLSLLLVIPILLSLESIFSPLWVNSILHSHCAVLVVMTMALGLVGFMISSIKNETATESTQAVASTWLLLSLIYATILTWLVPHALFSGDTGTMISLIIYTIIGIKLFVVGRSENLEAVKIIGIFYITAVVLRLLFVEIWNMGTEGRIVTFFVIGILFVSTAFIKKLYNDEDKHLPEQSQ